MNEPDSVCGAERGVRSWIRRPDSAFWRELFSPLPASTENDHLRRARITRYALGAALVSTLPYIFLALLLAPRDLFFAIVLNATGVACYGCGMWAGSLGAHRAARMWLLATLEGQLAVLVWMTGPILGVGVFALVAAALANVLFQREERWARRCFVSLPFLILIAALTHENASIVDFSHVPPAILSFARVANVLFAALTILLLLDVFDREVLKSEAWLMEERNRSDRLLHAVLPRKIAEELRLSDRTIADRHPEVTVLFADLAGFTPWAAQRPPEEVIAVLEQVFARFDVLVAAAGAEKIKTIGDAYMVVSGAPDPCADHARVIARLALDFVASVRQLREESGIPLDLRVGLHTGPVIAGVIGAMRFTYDIWGDTVNTASRMESHGEPGRIQMSTDTRARLEPHFAVEPRGSIEVKGKGRMETWWLVSERSPA